MRVVAIGEISDETLPFLSGLKINGIVVG